MDERDGTISHTIATSVNRAGYPVRLFTTNRWITADNRYAADDVVKMLDLFVMDLAWQSWPTNMWVTAMLCLFRPQIIKLIKTATSRWRGGGVEHPGTDVFEDKGCDITSSRRILVSAQIKRVNKALALAAV